MIIAKQMFVNVQHHKSIFTFFFNTITIFIYKITNKKLEVKTVKGVELPINILVVIAVAVIVLLGVIALYFGGFVTPAGVMTSEAAKEAGCQRVMRNPAGCITVDPNTILLDGSMTGVPAFDANDDGTITAADTLQELCTNYFGVATESGCRQLCGCSG